MSAISVLENNEDLENVPLVRMEDVQPDRSADIFLVSNKVFETNAMKSVMDHDYSCTMTGDEDSNIGSMVSIPCEKITDSNENLDIIGPENVTEIIKMDHPVQDSWPTLEISPGGVIKNSEKFEDLKSLYTMSDIEDEKEFMYACAKCSQRFEFLFNLVKHVKWHEDQGKNQELIKSNLYISMKKTHIHPKKKKVLKYKLKRKIADPNGRGQSVSVYHTVSLTEPPRKQGRPRKLKQVEAIPVESQRRRGRPRKQPF